ncbi:MAG TPA: hypothetical protein VI168_11420 [Croceibacterium sp.]
MIENRIADALADIRLELFRGNKDPKIIDEIASEYDLEPGVLALRLAKAYGSLEELEDRQAKSMTMLAIETRMKHAIHEYAKTEAGVDIAKWLEERAGREPSRQEVEYADDLWMGHALSKLMAGR